MEFAQLKKKLDELNERSIELYKRSRELYDKVNDFDSLKKWAVTHIEQLKVSKEIEDITKSYLNNF